MRRILIADDHPLLRLGVKQLLAEVLRVDTIDEVANGLLVLDQARRCKYDVVLLDIALPGRSGLDVLKDLKNEQPGLPVLMLSMYPEEQYAVRALKAGASGYLAKESLPDELVEAVRKVSEGRKYVSSSLAEKLALDLGEGAIEKPHESLSDREFQLLQGIASGKTIKQIAEGLLLSVKTVSTYRSRVLRKMHMTNNAELTRYAIENRLVD